MRNVLVIRVPGPMDAGALAEIRDYAIASLKLGVLALPDYADLSALSWVAPDDVEVIVEGEPAPLPSSRPAPAAEPNSDPEAGSAPGPAPNSSPSFSGPGSADKRRIYDMMKTYRVAQGLGCWTSVAEAIGESTDWVRSVYTGEVTAPLGMWRKIEKALDELTLGRNAITSSTGKE